MAELTPKFAFTFNLNNIPSFAMSCLTKIKLQKGITKSVECNTTGITVQYKNSLSDWKILKIIYQ